MLRNLISIGLLASMTAFGLGLDTLPAFAAGPPGQTGRAPGTPSAIQLQSSFPGRYAAAYENAEQYIARHVAATGAVTAGSGQPASADTAAYVAAALAETGNEQEAETVAGYLKAAENPDGGWSTSLSAGAPSAFGATARVLWALTVTAQLGGPSSAASLDGAIGRGANALLTFSSSTWGGFQSAGGLASAESTAVAIRALIGAARLAPPGYAPGAWQQAAQHAETALLSDNGVRRTVTSDFLAAPRWNLDPDPESARRTVDAMPDLGFAYQGYGAKAGPGYYTGMDWTDGVSTFNEVIAAVHAGLPDTAEMQYNYGLTLQNRDGGFGSSAHPPVGPETGGFQAGPNASSVDVTAHYLLATAALLAHGMVGFGWRSAVFSEDGGPPETVSAPAVASLDPAVAMHHGVRVAVVVSDPSTVVTAANPATTTSNEVNLELNAAWQLTQMGYNVSLFWYKPKHAENYYPLSYLWPNLSAFQVIVLADNAFADQNGYKTAFGQEASSLQSWIAQGGRLIDLGDRGVPPWTGPLAAGVAAGAVNQVSFQGQTLAWPGAAAAYYVNDPGYQTLIAGQSGTATVPVAIGAVAGQGRVVLTTLDVASHREDHLPITAALFGWVTQGLQPVVAPQVSFAQAAASLYATMQSTYAVGSTDLYRELSDPNAPQRRYSYLWPFTQAMAGLNASASAVGRSTAGQGLADDLQGLQRYYDSALTPPGYESYVASRGGGTAFFDDNGWTSLDLLRAYAVTGNAAFLTAAENDLAFLESGWNQTDPPPGGEYFNEDREDRTQTATGSMLDALLRAYLATKNPSDLTFAQTVKMWDRTYMRGLNGIYDDSMSPTGQVTGTPYTYDTGVVLQADVLLYRATGDPSDLIRAEQLAVAAIEAYVDPLNGVLIENAGSSNAPFNAILLRGLYMLWEADLNLQWVSPLLRQAELAVRYDRYPSGIYGNNWTGLNDPAVPVDLLIQGGTLRLLGMAASIAGR